MLKNWKYNTFSKYLVVQKKLHWLLRCNFYSPLYYCDLGNSRVETWNLRCFETSDLDFETRVSDPLSLSCWRTIPHYNLVIIIELSVVNVGNFTTTLFYEIWNFFVFFGTVQIGDLKKGFKMNTEILCNLSTKGVVQNTSVIKLNDVLCLFYY